MRSRSDFFKEHLHMDEEIRYILDGRGQSQCTSISSTYLPNHVCNAKSSNPLHLSLYRGHQMLDWSAGHIDIRKGHQQWIWVACNKGDMIVLPKGIYHRSHSR